LTIVPELLAGPTAELAVGLMIALGRRIVEGDEFVRSGRFAGWRPLLYGRGLAGSTVGIAGMGQLGRAVAERLAGFGCDLVYHDPSRLAPGDERRLGLRYAAFDELLADSHFTVLALPLNPSTVHLVDAAALARMRPGAILVNVGRGSVVVERDVVAALDAGTLGGYAADVYEMEDWARSDRPREVPEGLRRARGRSLLAPHLGSAVAGVRREIELAAARNVLAALGGARPPGAVNDPRV
jgi:phosphonate dehydrogenase